MYSGEVTALIASKWEDFLPMFATKLNKTPTRSGDLNEIGDWYKYHLQTCGGLAWKKATLNCCSSDNTGIQEGSYNSTGSHSTDLSIIVSITPHGCVACHLPLASPSVQPMLFCMLFVHYYRHFTRNN